MQHPRNEENLEKARVLRKNMTRQECHLWYDFLRNYPVRFRRQEIIGDYIADFFCHRAKLVIEIDGIQHFAEKATEYDNKRTEYLKSLNIKVLRFNNYEVSTEFDSVCEIIHSIVQHRIKSL